jgi:hypothetical protein
MAFKNLIAFGAGEITPELAERDNLEKMRTGLKALRNGVVTKYGGLRSRRGFVFSQEVDSTTIYCPENSPYVYIFGTDSVEVLFDEGLGFGPYKFNSTTTSYTTFTLSAEDLSNLHVTNNDEDVYCFVEDKIFFRMPLSGSVITEVTDFSIIISGSYTLVTAATGAPSGYGVDYTYTIVKDGFEGSINTIDATKNLPIAVGQLNTITVRNDNVVPPEEVRIYRRPRGSGAWGFIGLGTPVASVTPGFLWDYIITDVGQESDYTNQPPAFVSGFAAEGAIKPKTGLIYQNRLVIASKNKLYGSRTDSLEDFFRDFPLQDDGAVAFKTGSSGGAKIGRLYDGRGLLIATNVGIYETPSDVLKYDTAFAIKRSNVVHDDKIPIKGMGSSAFVTNKKLSGVFKLSTGSNDTDLKTTEVSIFSGHLFEQKNIVSWDIQDDGTQILWCVRDDGVLLAFSYQEDQELQSWSRNDTLGGKFKSVAVYRKAGDSDLLLAVIERDGVNYLEALSRKDLDVYDYIATDSSVIYKNQMIASDRWLAMTNTGLDPLFFDTGTLVYTGTIDRTVVDLTALNAIPADERYLGMVVRVGVGPYVNFELRGGLTNIYWNIFAGPFSNVAGLGAVGTVFRFFNYETTEYVDYEVTTFTNDSSVTVQLVTGLDRDFYDVMGAGTTELRNCYQTFTVLSGLDHLEGKDVSIRADGKTEASPLNTVRDYLTYNVVGGEVTLGDRAAIISVGLPVVTDLQTFDPQSMESVSAKTESTIVNKLFVSYYNSRGLYINHEFPADDTNTGMEDHERFFEPDDGIANYEPHYPYSRREEVVLNGDWSAASSTAFRNVDPQPIGIRGFILDEEKIGE